MFGGVMDQAIGILGQIILVLVAFAFVLGLVVLVLVEVQAIARLLGKLKNRAVIPEPYVVQSANGQVERADSQVL
jgi:hypothetical protein